MNTHIDITSQFNHALLHHLYLYIHLPGLTAIDHTTPHITCIDLTFQYYEYPFPVLATKHCLCTFNPYCDPEHSWLSVQTCGQQTAAYPVFHAFLFVPLPSHLQLPLVSVNTNNKLPSFNSHKTIFLYFQIICHCCKTTTQSITFTNKQNFDFCVKVINKKQFVLTITLHNANSDLNFSSK